MDSKSSPKTKTCKCYLLECTQSHVQVDFQHIVSFVHFSGHKFENLVLVVLYFHLFSPDCTERSKEKCPGFLSARFRKLYDSRSTWCIRWGKGKLDCSSFIPTHKRIVQGAKINHYAHQHVSANHFLGLLNLIWGKWYQICHSPWKASEQTSRLLQSFQTQQISSLTSLVNLDWINMDGFVRRVWYGHPRCAFCRTAEIQIYSYSYWRLLWAWLALYTVALSYSQVQV